MPVSVYLAAGGDDARSNPTAATNRAEPLARPTRERASRKGDESMRRILALLGAGALLLATTVPVAAADPGGAVVVHGHYLCNVGWDDSWSAEDPACEIQNVLQPNGAFREVLHGQIPADQMDAFRAAGSPSSYATSCLVNYGWLNAYRDGEDWGPLMVFTTSVRHFTPDGKMTEVCAPSVP
jgi:hypothetical protein